MVTLRVPIDVPEHVRTRTVLLVSDDADWRSSAVRVLAEAGYHVIAARHGGHALVESSRYPTVDVVVAEGSFGRSGLPTRIFEEHPHARMLHFPTRPRTREDLLNFINLALK
jgi:ActR/RegA family two-component response regulator